MSVRCVMVRGVSEAYDEECEDKLRSMYEWCEYEKCKCEGCEGVGRQDEECESDM